MRDQTLDKMGYIKTVGNTLLTFLRISQARRWVDILYFYIHIEMSIFLGHKNCVRESVYTLVVSYV